jgi:hypothetical protein
MAHEKLDAVKDTHNINPLPAYDLSHSMITPKDYEQCLLGTIVELHATFIRYLIGKKGTTLIADLQEVIVLHAPWGLPQSPTTRKLMAGPSSMTPKKPRVSLK